MTRFSKKEFALGRNSLAGIVIILYLHVSFLAEQLWETTMNPQHRILMQVTMEDAVAADEIFTKLMGENPELRRAFIEENAKLVAELDV